MKKIIIIVPMLVLSFLAGAQLQVQTTIKLVGGKARIAIKTTGTGSPTGFASNFVFVVAIPVANASATLDIPTVLDPTRVPGTLGLPLSSHTYTDATFKYYLLFYTGSSSASATYTNGTEYEILELNFSSTTTQNFPVSLMSLPDGNQAAPVDNGQWQQYLEIASVAVSDPAPTWFYASATSTVVQVATDLSTGTAEVRTNADITVLPVHLLNFSGYKNGNKNSLLWTTSTEENNRGFEVQSSNDGINYTAIGFVNSKAVAGNSNTELNYTFTDMNPAGKRQYYRLRQEDFDSRSRISNIVTIAGDKPNVLAIGSLFPNPASALVNVIIDAPKRDKVTLVVSDINGKMVKQQSVNVDIGSNTVPVEISNLAKGSYLVKLVCQSSDCETAAGKFTKQ